MHTFLRLELAGRGDTILVNVDHIVRIHRTYPHGATIVTSDDASLNTVASLDDILTALDQTNGRVVIKTPLVRRTGVDVAYEKARADLLP